MVHRSKQQDYPSREKAITNDDQKIRFARSCHFDDACGSLPECFNTDVQISKSDLEFLRSQILTYTMVETTYGNFSPDESSLAEVL